MAVKTGNYTYLLENTPSVLSFGAVGSKKESEGPLGQYFDVINPDSSFGEEQLGKSREQNGADQRGTGSVQRKF